MPDITITFTVSANVQAVVVQMTTLHNEATGDNLTPKQWVKRQCKTALTEIIFSEEIGTLRSQKDVEFQTARDALEGGLA